MNSRILITCPDLKKGGGVSSYCRTLQPYLGSNVDFFSVGARNNREKGWRQAIRMVSDYFRFWSTLKKCRYTLVHLNPSLDRKALLRDALLLAMAKMCGSKVLVFIHGWDERCEALIRKKYLRIFQGIYFRADALVVLANEFKEKLLAMGCDKRVIVETTTVDDEIFSRDTFYVRSSTCTTFNILYLSRVEKEKGVYEAINAYNILKASHPNTTLTVAGDGAELSRARQYVSEQQIKDVYFSGYVTGDEKHKAFRHAHVYFFPTWWEGMPISVLEAMAYGLPIITRPVGGIKDFFIDGEMGFTSNSLEPKVFAGLLERLINDSDLSTRIGVNNRKYAQNNFAASKVAERIKDIYNKMLIRLHPET